MGVYIRLPGVKLRLARRGVRAGLDRAGCACTPGWWRDGRRWTDNYAPIEPAGTDPALRSTAPLSQPSQTSRGIEAGEAYDARGPDVEDEDPSDILRRVQAGMSAARLSVPLDEQIEVVGEQFYPKEVRKLFRECGMPITAAGCTLGSSRCSQAASYLFGILVTWISTATPGAG
jgi:hypothetical protein